MRRITPYSLTFANKITIIRILCVPVFVLMLIYYILSVQREEPNEVLRWVAMMIFAVAALSDALDGYFARARDEVTKLGTVLDPMADKALLLAAVVLLGRPFAVAFEPCLPIWFVMLVVSRDVVLFLGAMVVHYITGNVMVRPRITGKAATFFQMLLVIWVFAAMSKAIFFWLLGAATLFTSVSALQYIYDGFSQVEKA